jgi:transcriptional regulator with XRE-family HTH domain
MEQSVRKIPTAEEITERWLLFNLVTVYQNSDILEVGRQEDRVARAAKTKMRGQKIPNYLKGRPTWKDLREMNELSRDELAAKVGCDRASISRYETGARWPDQNSDYVRWLKAAYAPMVKEAEEDIAYELLLREGWLIPDPEREGFNTFDPALNMDDDLLAEVFEAMDEKIVQPWLAAGMPETIEGHHTPADHGLKGAA